MRSSTTFRKTERPSPGAKIRPWAIAFWLILWQIAAMAVGRDFLLASPVTVLLRLWELVRTAAFWSAALHSAGRILLGFLLGALTGAICAGISLRWRRMRELIAPLHAVLRAIPVASFVVVALIWMPSRNLSVLISFLVVFPLIYAGTLSELERADANLLEMARIFRMKPLRRLIYVYALPALPAFASLCATAIGMAWKSGVAAELISIPASSIGERLYKAKVYLMTGELFAWTLAIVLLSAVCARLLRVMLRRLAVRLEGM